MPLVARYDDAPAGMLPREAVLFEGYPAVVPGFGALLLVILTLGLGWLPLYLRSRSTTYRITTRRVIIEHGLLSKRLEQVDTVRIRDFIVERPFGQRLLGTGNMQLVTTDLSTPVVRLTAIRTNVRILYERLRAACDQERTLQGVKIVE